MSGFLIIMTILLVTQLCGAGLDYSTGGNTWKAQLLGAIMSLMIILITLLGELT